MPSPRPIELLLADENVDPGRFQVAGTHVLRMVRVVRDEVRLEHPNRPVMEKNDVVVGGVGTLDRRQVVLDDPLERPGFPPPLTYVRTLEPLVQQRQVVGDHRPEIDRAHQPSRIG